MNMAFKFRIYPNNEQLILINQTLGHTRFLWNKMLEDKNRHYETTKEHLYTLPSQYKDEYPFLRDVDSLALANVQQNLKRAYSSFFKGKSGFPEFKKKCNDYGYTTNNVNNNIAITSDGKYIKLPKLGLVKLVYHRNIPNNMKLKNVTVSKSKTDKYYVSINCCYNHYIVDYNIKDTLGLDFSIAHFYVDSNGNKVSFPDDIIYDYKRLRILQRSLSRKYQKLTKEEKLQGKTQSNNFYKNVSRIAKMYEKITNKKNDFLHKLSNQIANDYDSVSVESLDLIKMSQDNKYYAKQLSRFGYKRFLTFLGYKLERLGKRLIYIDKWYASSKTCSVCSNIKDNLKLNDRTYYCTHCGNNIDRDYNAAINIKHEGLKVLSSN